MALLIPAIKGRIGNTEYFETTMRVRDLVTAVRRPSELDEWANFSIEERMQRELDDKRVREQIVPYLTRNEDRFFRLHHRPGLQRRDLVRNDRGPEDQCARCV